MKNEEQKLRMKTRMMKQSIDIRLSLLPFLLVGLLGSCGINESNSDLPTASNIEMGRFNYITMKWEPASNIMILDSSMSYLFSELENSNASHILKVEFSGWNNSPSQLCGIATIHDGQGDLLSSKFPIKLFKKENSDDIDTYFSVNMSDSGTFTMGKILLFVNSEKYNESSYERTHVVYLPIQQGSKYFTRIVLPDNQEYCVK